MEIMTKKIFALIFCILFITSAKSNADALCIKVSKANIRTGPGTKYEIAWEVYKYMPFAKVGVSLGGDWYAVRDVDGDVNWVYRNLITDQFNCAVVKSEYVNVRTGPGTRYPKSIISPSERYDSFKILKILPAWVKVKDEWGNTGWIHRNFLWIQ